MKRLVYIALLAALFMVGAMTVAYSQTVEKSYFVRADGNDDVNNGRSESTPFKTVEKALQMATAGSVKKITIIGHVGSFCATNTGTLEILITGKKDASDDELAVIQGPANDTNNGYYDYDKYAVCVNSGSIIKFENIELTGGLQYKGSGLQISGGTVTLGVGAVIKGNVARDAGGGVYVESGLLILDGGEISGNTASDSYDQGEGGGVFIDSQGSFIMKRGIISNNHAEGKYGRGGGIYAVGTFNLLGGEIKDNFADELGGGIYLAGKKSTVVAASVLKNKAKQGGGFFIASNGSLSIQGGSVIGNEASYGGGIYLDGRGVLSLDKSLISENNAEFAGGGVYVAVAAVYADKGSKIVSNTAGDGDGPDIFLQK